jgi:hypothetical protein
MASPSMPSLVDEATLASSKRPAAARSSESKLPLWKSTTFRLAISGVALLAALIILGAQLFGGPPSAAELSRTFTVMDSVSGEVFKDFRVPDKGGFPWNNPRTGKPTLYPCERCYWTKDNKAKKDPTHVILNQHIGKDGGTVCPDCGRKVVLYNPMPPMKLMNEALGIKEESPPPAEGK